jgi:hypothetical protein
MKEQARIGDVVELCGPMNPESNGMRGEVVGAGVWVNSGIEDLQVRTVDRKIWDCGIEAVRPIVRPGKKSEMVKTIYGDMTHTECRCLKCGDEFDHYDIAGQKSLPQCPICDPINDTPHVIDRGGNRGSFGGKLIGMGF